MGYTTQFQGKIQITPELKANEIKFIQGMYGDMREWNPEEAKKLDLTWFQWELNDYFDALEWDGGEKFYDAVEKMEYIIGETEKKYPHIRFNGIVQAQGEEFDDRWQLIVKDNKVSKKEIKVEGTVHECPDCGYKWQD